MTESEGVPAERISKLRHAAREAQKLGIVDPALRREAVIDAKTAVSLKNKILPLSEEQAEDFPSVAKRDPRNESPQVIETAVNKYLTVEEGLARTPILIDAVHAVKPENIPDTNPASDEYDEDTDKIARQVAELTGASLMIAKKSRLISDLNRPWWKREERSNALPKEYSRSGRAALYWAIRKILIKSNRLDSEEKLKSPFYRIAIHGMKDNNDFDCAIGGNEGIADPEFIKDFEVGLVESLKGVGLEAKVVIARKDDEQTKAYRGPDSLRHFRTAPKPEYLIQHQSFGEKFQTVQLEIAKNIRTNPEKRDKFSLALANTLKKLQ